MNYFYSKQKRKMKMYIIKERTRKYNKIFNKTRILTENLNLFNPMRLRNYIKYPNVFKNINPNMFKNPMRLRTYCV